MVWDTTVKLSMLKFISCGGVGSLDLDRRPWLHRPCSHELRDERLGPRPCSSPLTDREWAVLLSLLVVRGRLRKSLTALLVSCGLLRGLTLGGGGRCGGVLGPAACRPSPVCPGCRRIWTPPTRPYDPTMKTPWGSGVGAPDGAPW